MCRRLIFLLFFIVLGTYGTNASAQTTAINGWCQMGATQALVSSMKSTNYQQGIIPSCTVTVYLSGTQILATIYKDGLGTPLTNPFTASTTGKWLFFPSLSSGVYDIVMSGGTPPNVFPAPVSLTAVSPGGGGGGGGTGLQSFNGRTAPNAVLIPGDFTTILSGSPFGFSGSGGLAYDSGTGIVSPSSQWQLSGGNLTGLGTFNLNNGTTNTVVLNPNGTASFAGQLAFGGGGAITTSDIICLSTGIHCPAAPTPQYQTIQINGVSVTPAQPKLNFLSGFAGVNNGGNSSTDISLSNVPNSALANNSITINTSGSISGGGAVALGGNLTLTGSFGTTSVTGATANGFAVTTTNPTTTPVVSVNVDSTHFLPINNGSASLFLNQAGTYTTPPGSVSTVSGVNANGFVVTVSNPSTTPSISVNTDSGHILPVTGGNAGLFLNQAGTYTAAPASSPAGSACDVQFNNGGLFGADTGHFCYTLSTHTLNADNFLSPGSITTHGAALRVDGGGAQGWLISDTDISGENSASVAQIDIQNFPPLIVLGANGSNQFQISNTDIIGTTTTGATRIDIKAQTGTVASTDGTNTLTLSPGVLQGQVGTGTIFQLNNGTGNLQTQGNIQLTDFGTNSTYLTDLISGTRNPGALCVGATTATCNGNVNASSFNGTTFTAGTSALNSSGLTLGSSSRISIGGDTWINRQSTGTIGIGGVTPGGTDGTLRVQNIYGGQINYDYLLIFKGLLNGAGLQVATGTPCALSAGVGQDCVTTINLPITEPDTNYVVLGCGVQGNNTVVSLNNFGNMTTTNFLMHVTNLGAGSGSAVGTISCLVVHP